jgi:hypothetical protein
LILARVMPMVRMAPALEVRLRGSFEKLFPNFKAV